MQPHRPTIKDVAMRAGVSFKTVSRVINAQAGVRPELRARVRAAIAELGYVINYSAKALAEGRSRTIGVVIPRLTDPYSFEVVHHVGEASESHRTGVVILTRLTLADPLSIGTFVGHGIVGALLLVAPHSIAPYLPVVTALRIPTVVVETPFIDEGGHLLVPPVPCFVSDNRRGAASAATYLLDLGHRRIAYIRGADAPQSRLRYLGVCDALGTRGVSIAGDYVRPGHWGWQSGHEQMRALLALAEPPTAVLCANDAMALGAIGAAAESGLNVPDDVSIMGFDDIQAAAHSVPALSTVHQPAAEMVRLAIEQLVAAMNGAALDPVHHVLPTALVIRGSCAPPSAGQQGAP